MSLANLFDGSMGNGNIQTAAQAAAAAPAAPTGYNFQDPNFLASMFGADWKDRAASGQSITAPSGYHLTANMSQNSPDYSGSEYVPGLASSPQSYSLYDGTGQKTNYMYGLDGNLKGTYEGSDQGFWNGMGQTLKEGLPLILASMAGFGAIGGMTGAGMAGAMGGAEGLSGMDLAADASSGFMSGSGYIPGTVGGGSLGAGAAPGSLGSGSYGLGNIPGLSDLPTGGALGSGTYGVPGMTGGAAGAGISGATDWLAATGGGLGGAGMGALGGAAGASAGGGGSSATAGGGSASSGGSITGNPIIDKILGSAGSSALSNILGGGSSSGSSGSGGGLLGNLGGLLSGGLNYYQQNQMADKLFNYVNGAKASIDNLYNPNSPEYKTLWDQMSAKDAASGRNSQYGTRTVDFMGKTAATKAAMQVDLAKGLSGMFQNGATAQANAPAGLAAALGGANGVGNSLVQNLSSYLNNNSGYNLGSGLSIGPDGSIRGYTPSTPMNSDDLDNLINGNMYG